MHPRSPWPPLPPSTARLGAARTRWDGGHSAIRWPVPDEERFHNAQRSLHGGYLCVLLDAVLGSALASLEGQDVAIVNPDLTVHFLAPVECGAILIAEGHVLRHGRTLSFVEAQVRNEASGELVATAQSTVTVRARRPRREPAAASNTVGMASSVTAEPPPPRAPQLPALPPWFVDFGAELRPLADGEVELIWPIRDQRFENRHHLVQGGFVAFVADSAMGFALIAGSGATSMATTTLAVQLMRPVRTGDLVRVHARNERRGRRFGFMVCDVEANGKLVARGRASGLLPAT